MSREIYRQDGGVVTEVEHGSFNTISLCLYILTEEGKQIDISFLMRFTIQL